MKDFFDRYYMEEHMRLCHFRNHYEVKKNLGLVNHRKKYRYI